VHWVRHEEPVSKNTTFTIDICKPIGVKKGVAKEDQCPGGTRGKKVPLSAHCPLGLRCSVRSLCL
jgi:hypothetical protein